VYDMYPWGNPADSGCADIRQVPPEPRRGPAEARRLAPEPRRGPVGPRHVPAAAIRAVQVALDRRDNGGDAIAAASAPGASQLAASQPTASRTR
jgi:hypothetical protein